MYAPRLVTPPNADDPVVTLDHAKLHLSVEHTDHDVLIAGMVAAAVGHLEGWAGILGRCLVTQTWSISADAFCRVMRLPFADADRESVVVTATDSSGAETTIDSELYDVLEDAIGAYVRFRNAFSAPGDLAEAGGVTITADFGYGAAAAVPAQVRLIVLLLVGHWYLNRETVLIGSISSQLAYTVEALTAPLRRVGI